MTNSVHGYQIGELILEGPSADVHKARRTSDDRPVLLKILKPMYPPPDRLARFKREYEMTRTLSVPGVLQTYGFESSMRRYAIVLEDNGGDFLSHALRSGPFAVPELISFAINVVDALGQVHERDVIHKDINPSNILWNRATGQAALSGLGIATVLSRENPSLKSPDLLEGTLAYISPEQTGRMNRAVDYRTDFYSLGVTLYQLFTGELPFSSTDPMELAHCHIARRPTPPNLRRPDVPGSISDLIMRLMEKTAEARYQSTYGIKADLQEFLDRLGARRAHDESPLRRHDVSQKFQISQKLYGRDKEIEALLDAFDRVACRSARDGMSPGPVEMMLVAGEGGLGKSVLVQELYKPITRQRGYFISGKFEALQRGSPYFAVVRAFRSLVRQILSESEARLSAWRAEILAALGSSAQLIVDVIPEVGLVIGPQPPVPELGPTESKNRFNFVLQSFIRVFARRAHPLVLFLDDLQWADSASLQLIELLMSDEVPQCLFLIGAYRDNEIGHSHPLSMSLDALGRGGAVINRIHLSPLGLSEAAALVADTLGRDQKSVTPLAKLVLRRTEGNPLFVNELLKAIYRDGLLKFDRQEGRWQWDIVKIEAQSATDDVVDFMVRELKGLPEALQEALRLAACLGSSFDLHTLSTILEKTPVDTAATLLPAVRGGFVLMVSEPEVVPTDSGDARLLVQHYKFLHDRVQQAAYALILDDQKPLAHLRIGRLLLAHTPQDERAEMIFELTAQLNRGRALLTDDGERVEIARLNLEAGKKAKAATAYAAAREHLIAGEALLPERRWEDHEELSLALYKELADVESLNGNHEQAERLAMVVLEHARSPIEKAAVYRALVGQYTMRAKYDEAIGAARSGLALLDIHLPEQDLPEAMGAELAEAQKRLEGRELASLLDAPELTDPRANAAMKLLVAILSTAFYVSPVFYSLIIFKAVNMSLEYGNAREASDLYSWYGHILSGVLGQHQAGYDFATLSVRLSEKWSRASNTCRSSFIAANFVLPWVKHLHAALPINNAGYKAGLESGELEFAGYILIYKLFNAFYEGRPIEGILKELPSFLYFNESAKNRIAIDIILGLRLALGDLSSAGAGGAGGEGIREAEYLAMCESHRSTMALCYYHILKAQVLYLHGEPGPALAAATAADDLLPSILGNVATAQHTFYKALSLAALIGDAAPDSQKAHREALAASLEKLSGWATGCPENFAAMHAIASAEAARTDGRAAEATELYDRAIRSAEENDLAHLAALANELSARLWLHQKRDKVAAVYMTEARYGYQAWGARRKVADIEARYPQLLGSVGPEARGAAGHEAADVLDLGSVIKASQAISSEIVLERLLTKLVEIVIENAGAQRGFLILEKNGELMIQVEAKADRGQVEHVGQVEALRSTPVAGYAGISEGIVVYVARTLESVILSDAAHEGDFTENDYVVQNRPKSILCMPLLNQGKLSGILYLENNLTAGAFTPGRLEVLRLLSSQVAISIENALLYSELERRVEDRTLELRKKNEDLADALQHLKTTQARLIQAEKMASLGQLTAGISHEIKNPLNFVKNFAEINLDLSAELLAEVESDPEARLRDMKETLADLKLNSAKIVEQSNRADAIVQSMTRHASGARGQRAPIDLNALVDQYVDLASHGTAASRSDVRVVIERDYDKAVGTVEAVGPDIGRAMVNLLNNAFYAVHQRRPAARGAYTPTVWVSTKRNGDQISIRVRDNGMGMPKAVKEKVFEPFFTTKPAGSGTGLGLSLSYEIVVQGHGGTMEVESVEGEGSTFVITLPAP